MRYALVQSAKDNKLAACPPSSTTLLATASPFWHIKKPTSLIATARNHKLYMHQPYSSHYSHSEIVSHQFPPVSPLYAGGDVAGLSSAESAQDTQTARRGFPRIWRGHTSTRRLFCDVLVSAWIHLMCHQQQELESQTDSRRRQHTSKYVPAGSGRMPCGVWA